MSDDARPVTVPLAAFVAATRTADLSSRVGQTVREHAAVVLAAAARASGAPVVRAVVASFGPDRSTGVATALGQDSPVGACRAALCNGTAAGSIGHSPSVSLALPVIAAACAATELAAGDLDTFLVAVLAGLEVAGRLDGALDGQHLERGWYPPGTAGRVGAAAAAARALALPARTVQDAFGYAATQAAGLARSATGVARALVLGRSASDGLEAAVLAAHGLIGPALPLEGRRGLFALEAPGARAERVIDGLGTTWVISRWSSPAPGEGHAAVLGALGDGGSFEDLRDRLRELTAAQR